MKIERLQIYTAAIEEQLHFYTQVLGLEARNQTGTSFEVKTGYSTLCFRHKEKATPYHIAFHIPADREQQALEWLKQRVDIIKDGENELVDFRSWRARSVYFYDAGKNVVEFISRKHWFPPQTHGFSQDDLMGISEIGLATNEVGKAFDFLNQNFSLEKFTGDYEKFCATGDDQGLFIVIDKNQKDWFPSQDKAFASDFRIMFTTGATTVDLSYINERLELL